MSGAYRTAALAIVATAVAVAAPGCGGDDGPAAVPASGFARDTPVRRFTCEDWNRAEPVTRRRVVESIREFAGGPLTGEGVRGRGAVLEDEDAYRLFDSSCGAGFKRGFLLYKLYTHAAAFSGRAP